MTDAAGRRFELRRYAACVFDLDGTIWLGPDRPIPGAPEFVGRCRDLGIAIAYATNSTVQTPESLSERLVDAGVAHPAEPVVTSGVVMARALRRLGITRAVAVVPDQLAATLTAAGIDVVSPDDMDPRELGSIAPEHALVLAASRGATIGAIERLGRLAAAGHPLYASSTDPGFPAGDGIEPGGGVLLAALRTMYDVDATVLGKPSAAYADTVVDALGAPTGPIAVFGDSHRADIGIADHLGADGVLLTAHSLRGIDRQLRPPRFIAPTLADPITPFEELT